MAHRLEVLSCDVAGLISYLFCFCNVADEFEVFCDVVHSDFGFVKWLTGEKLFCDVAHRLFVLFL